MLTPKEALVLAQRKHKGQTMVDCVDFGDRYGFSFVPWDKNMGPFSKERAYKEFLISSWFTIHKRTGKTGGVSAASYFANNAKPPRVINI